MGGKYGIKDFLELIVACMLVSIAIIKRLRDGFQVSDLTALFADIAIDPEVQAGFEGVGNVPKEVADIDVAEGLQIGKKIFDFVPKFIAAFKGTDAPLLE